MAKDVFERFPPATACMVDKLPAPDEHGRVWLEGHWWRKERDQVALTVAALGAKLHRVQAGLDRARDANDVDAIRGGCALALVNIEEALLPIIGADRLWPLKQAIHMLEHAGRGKRHWLTALRTDVLHTRRDAPERVIMQSLAAATLDYFAEQLDEPQESIAQRIASALATGGFYVRSGGRKGPPSARTVQQWRIQCLPGSKSKPAHPKMREMFTDFRSQLGRQQLGRTPTGHFDAMLSDLAIHSRDHREYGPLR